MPFAKKTKENVPQNCFPFHSSSICSHATVLPEDKQIFFLRVIVYTLFVCTRSYVYVYKRKIYYIYKVE